MDKYFWLFRNIFAGKNYFFLLGRNPWLEKRFLFSRNIFFAGKKSLAGKKFLFFRNIFCWGEIIDGEKYYAVEKSFLLVRILSQKVVYFLEIFFLAGKNSFQKKFFVF